MCNTSSIFRVSSFRNRLFAWIMLTIFCFSFMSSVSHAQQPTATLTALNGSVLVNGQEQGKGTILTAGDVIETQAGASAVLILSDGSQVELGEHTKVNLAVLSQTAAGTRVSRLKLLWGRIRAFLSPQHQIEGSSFDIETPNALIGVTFSEPDIEVSYNVEKAETVGVAHTVELLARSLVTDEETLVPVGSSVIITAVGIKVIAGIIGVGGASSAGSTGTGTASTTASTGSTGMGTGTKVAIGVGAAAAAGGVVALATSSGDGDDSSAGNGNDSDDSCTTAECTGDLSGDWRARTYAIAEGCTEDVALPDDPACRGDCACAHYNEKEWYMPVQQSGNRFSGSHEAPLPISLDGFVDGNSVSFTTYNNDGPFVPSISNHTGVLSGNTIQGDYSGSGVAFFTGGQETITWTGTFTVTIQK